MQFIIPFILSSFIYVYSFINLGNTVYRKNSNNEIKTNYLILLTEGLFGPLRSFYYSVVYNSSGFEYLKSQLFQWYNPYFTYPFVFCIFYFIKFIYNKQQNYYLEKTDKNKKNDIY